MGVEPFVILASLLCEFVCAQRLMRRVCKSCSKSTYSLVTKLRLCGVFLVGLDKFHVRAKMVGRVAVVTAITAVSAFAN